MAKEVRKEIRVVFKFSNKNDVMLYEKLKELNQPSKLLKELAFDHFFKEENNKVDNSYNEKLLNVLEKLSDKIDNLGVVQVNPETEKVKDNEVINNDIQEISLDAEINTDDLNDLDF